ncbi:ErfK/YbiS/YcfS/YnhG family protein [Escherichia coli]|uniref:ErfK/YbiS/YcfS/YnhG family protein n=1 Tax=Escherichia coli TaxID=562 RepID=A0A376TEX1_ECOLX|nr:ErfK/YbiS/YcfS/YnhG family protein [Escherichia coli]
MMRRVNIFCSFALLFASHNSLAVTYPLPPEGSRLVGQSFTVTVPDHNTSRWRLLPHNTGKG